MGRIAWILAKATVNERERYSKKRAIKQVNAEFTRKANDNELAFFNRVKRTSEEKKAYILLIHEYKSTFDLEADSRRLKNKSEKSSITSVESLRLKCLIEMINYRMNYYFAPFKGEYSSTLTSVDAQVLEKEQSSVLFSVLVMVMVMVMVIILLYASGVSWGYILGVFVFGLITLLLFYASKSAKAKSNEIKQKEAEAIRKKQAEDIKLKELEEIKAKELMKEEERKTLQKEIKAKELMKEEERKTLQEEIKAESIRLSLREWQIIRLKTRAKAKAKESMREKYYKALRLKLPQEPEDNEVEFKRLSDKFYKELINEFQ